MKRRSFLATTSLALALAVTATSAAWAENAKLKIGFVGVTSGPAAAWGISNQRSMEAGPPG
jgi:branched-chain amino acid transport system substrate-binding protein